jgi:hypothetical protein
MKPNRVGRPSLKPERSRTRLVTVRFAPPEFEHLKTKAEKTERTVSQFVRDRALAS